MLIREALHEFLLAYQADGRSRKTTKWYKTMLSEGPYNPIDWLINHEFREVESVTTGALRQYIVWMREQPNVHNGKPRSEYTINGLIRCIHRFFTWCSNEYNLPNVVKGRIKYPKNPPPEPKAVKLETAIKLILSCGDDIYGVRNRAMLMFLLSSGARREEVASLTVERLDLEQRIAVVYGKGNKHRPVIFDPLTSDAINEWMKMREPEEYLFYNMRTRERLKGEGIRTIIKKIAAENGIEGKVNPHGWRHLFAFLYHQSGGSIASLSKLLGHAHTGITADTYLVFAMETALHDYERLNPMQKVAEALKQKNHSKTSGSTN